VLLIKGLCFINCIFAKIKPLASTMLITSSSFQKAYLAPAGVLFFVACRVLKKSGQGHPTALEVAARLGVATLCFYLFIFSF
jgi:hypothetical protein